MARVFEILKEKSLVIFNEDELEEGKLYFTTLVNHELPLYKEIPGMVKINGKNSEHMILDEYDITAHLDYELKNLNFEEPFMVLQKEKRHAKYTCIQVLQGEKILWIIQKYPNLTRKDFDGYYSAVDWPDNFYLIERFINREKNKKLEKEISQVKTFKSIEETAAFYIKDFLKQKNELERRKAANAPMFKSLKEKYSKKV